MAKKKGHCKRWSKTGKRRCLKRVGGSRRPRVRGHYRRGHRPFNKGKRCLQMGVNRRGKPTCVSYGGKPRRTGARARIFSPQGSYIDPVAAMWRGGMLPTGTEGLGSYRRSRYRRHYR